MKDEMPASVIFVKGGFAQRFVERACENCGLPLAIGRPTYATKRRRFCSPRCRVAANRKAKKV